MIFYLKTQGGWRETSQIDHTLAPATAAADARRLIEDRLNTIKERNAALAAMQQAPAIGWTGQPDVDNAEESQCNSHA